MSSDLIQQAIEIQNAEIARKNANLVSLVQRARAGDLTPEELAAALPSTGHTLEQFNTILNAVDRREEMETELATLSGQDDFALQIIEQDRQDAETFNMILDAREASQANNRELLRQTIANVDRANLLRTILEQTAVFVGTPQAVAV